MNILEVKRILTQLKGQEANYLDVQEYFSRMSKRNKTQKEQGKENNDFSDIVMEKIKPNVYTYDVGNIRFKVKYAEIIDETSKKKKAEAKIIIDDITAQFIIEAI